MVVSRTMKARRTAGTCSMCGKTLLRGQMIGRIHGSGKWVHVKCVVEDMSPGTPVHIQRPLI